MLTNSNTIIYGLQGFFPYIQPGVEKMNLLFYEMRGGFMV